MEENTQEIIKESEDSQSTVKKVNGGKYYILGVLSGMLIALIIIGLGILVSYTYRNTRTASAIRDVERAETTPATGNRELVNEQLIKKMAAIETLIDKYYLDEYTTDMIENGVYNGMLDSLGDKYAKYYSRDEVKELNKQTGGYFCGIGATVAIDKETEMCIIVEPIAGSPAEGAGLLPGDLIYKVDGTDTTGMPLNDIVALMRGEEDTIVHLTILRKSEGSTLEVDISRGRVESTSVGYEMLEGDIGHIAISTFDDNTADQFVDALATLKGQDAKGIIIDVRSNLGGNVSAVVDICRNILPEGNIVYTLDKYGQREEYNCDGTHQLELPLVVLVNQYSASASEILTGAVKDYKLGTIVGMRTYGKGVVQKVVSLTDGSAIKLTASKYYTPNGICINGTGIEPDVEVELDYENYRDNGIDNQLNTAIEEINKLINN